MPTEWFFWYLLMAYQIFQFVPLILSGSYILALVGYVGYRVVRVFQVGTDLGRQNE